MTATVHGATPHHTSPSDEGTTVLLIGGLGDAARLGGPIARWTGASVTHVCDLETATRVISTRAPYGIVTTMPLTDDEGLTLLMWMAVHHPEIPVVVIADPLSRDQSQQAEWFGARAAFAGAADLDVLSADVAAALGLSPSIDIWDHIAAVAVRSHLTLVSGPVEPPGDAMSWLTGLFHGLAGVRGLRGSVVLSADGSLIAASDVCPSLDVRSLVPSLQILIDESHSACTGVGLGDLETAVFHSAACEWFVVSCCADGESHVHLATVVAADGNRAVVELAHRRLRSEGWHSPRHRRAVSA